VRNERVVLLKPRLSDSALQLKVKSLNQPYKYHIKAAKCTVINSQNSKSFIVEKLDKQLEDRSLSMNHSEWSKTLLIHHFEPSSKNNKPADK